MATIDDFSRLRGVVSQGMLLAAQDGEGLSVRAVTAAQMRELDRRAQKEFGIPEIVLMEHAGLAVAREVRKVAEGRPSRAGQVLVLSGGGANGGDGFVAARHLHNWGNPVEVVLLADPQRIRGAALTNFGILERLGVPLHRADTKRRWEAWAVSTRRRCAKVLVDALLGTGASGPLREPVRSAILWVNRQRFQVVSVDLPSGLSADRGQPEDVAVRANRTVTCGLPKVGLLRAGARSWCGRITVADISLPRALRAPCSLS